MGCVTQTDDKMNMRFCSSNDLLRTGVTGQVRELAKKLRIKKNGVPGFSVIVGSTPDKSVGSLPARAGSQR